jgi:short-subunit dehydrogenase
MIQESSRDPHFQGHIVNTASMAGLLTAPSQGIYNVSKHAVVALSEALFHDLEIVTNKIHCSVLCPSYVKTNIADSSRNRPGELMNQTGLTLSQQVARDSVASSVDAGDVTAAEVSEVTFQAIRNEDFYIFPSKGSLARVKRRMEDILAEKNPADWFQNAPAIQARRQRLMEAFGHDRQ